MAAYEVKLLDPARRRRLMLIALLALICALAGAYRLGYTRAGLNFNSLDQENGHLRRRVVRLENKQQDLLESKALLQQSCQLDQSALISAKEELARGQDELVELKEDLVFYRSLLTPADQEPGLNVQRLDLRKLEGEERQFAYSLILTLTQIRGNDGFVQGRVELSAKKISNSGEPSPEPENPAPGVLLGQESFKFKFYQKIDGVLTLPEGMESPEEMESVLLDVSLIPKGRRIKRVNQSFQLHTLVGG